MQIKDNRTSLGIVIWHIDINSKWYLLNHFQWRLINSLKFKSLQLSGQLVASIKELQSEILSECEVICIKIRNYK